MMLEPVHISIHVFSLISSPSKSPGWLPYSAGAVVGVLTVVFLYGYARITRRPLPSMLYQSLIIGWATVCAIAGSVVQTL